MILQKKVDKSFVVDIIVIVLKIKNTTSSLGEAPIWRQTTAQKRRETPMGQQNWST